MSNCSLLNTKNRDNRFIMEGITTGKGNGKSYALGR